MWLGNNENFTVLDFFSSSFFSTFLLLPSLLQPYMDLARKEKKDRCDKDARFKRQINVDKNIVRKMVLSFFRKGGGEGPTV